MTQPNNAAPLDVAALLEALRADVRSRRLARGNVEADGLERDLQRALDDTELHRVVSAHWPLIGHTLPERVVALVNKLVRRYLRWYINPIVEQQNAYNETVARTLRLLADAYANLAAQRGDGGPLIVDGGAAQGVDRTANNDLRSTVHGLPSNHQQLVRERAAAEPPAAFPDLELRAQELQLKLRENVTAHWPLGGHTLPERTIALVNKLVRRYLRWYINPIVEQQNAANAAITVALLAIVRLDAERRARVAAERAARVTK